MYVLEHQHDTYMFTHAVNLMNISSFHFPSLSFYSDSFGMKKSIKKIKDNYV